MEKDKNIISMEQFVELYNKEIWPLVKDIVPKRKRLKLVDKDKFGSFVIYFLLFFIIIFSLGVIFGILNTKYYENLIFLYVLFLVCVGLFGLKTFLLTPSQSEIDKIQTEIMLAKKICMKKVLKFFGEDIHWGNIDFTDEMIYRSKLFPAFAESYEDDEFYGWYKGVNFKVSEIILKSMMPETGNFNYVPVFKGVILSFTSNKIINKGVVVFTKGDLTVEDTFKWHDIFFIPHIIFGGILKNACNKYYINIPEMQKVELEDSLWNKRFDVYAEDQVEARYLLTTGFMERFYNLKTAFGAKQLKCSFYDDQLMIAISTDEDVFEFWDLKSPYKVYKQLSSILNLIEYFKLNEKTGL